MSNRREFLTVSSVGAASLLIASSCGGKSVSGVVAIITGAVSELKPLYPAQSAALDKVVRLAADFNADWVAGKFDSAKGFFTNLNTLVTQLITDLGVSATAKVKLLLATLGIAVRTIAALIAEEGANQPKAAARAGATANTAVTRVRQLANASDADAILKQVMK